MNTVTESSPLKEALTAGGVLELFPLMKDWNREKLLHLRAEIEQLYVTAGGEIEKWYQSEVFKPENFFSQPRSKALDAAMNDARLELLAVCSEIESVICFYLPDEPEPELDELPRLG